MGFRTDEELRRSAKPRHRANCTEPTNLGNLGQGSQSPKPAGLKDSLFPLNPSIRRWA